VELGVFTELSPCPLSADVLGDRIGINARGRHDFLDALVALGMLQREEELYRNTPATDAFLDRAKPTYIGAILEVANAQFYTHWGALTAALQTGKPQHAETGGGFIESISADPAQLGPFMRSMTALSQGASARIALTFPWDCYATFADLGCAQGGLPVELARTHPHLTGIGFDFPQVERVFTRYVAANGLDDRLRFQGGDFFVDPLPKADVVTLGHILHGASLDQKRALLRRVHETLPPGGAVIVFDAIIDDDRRVNDFGLLMSLNMLVHTAGGFDYTAADCCQWMLEAGFVDTWVRPLVGPDSMVVGIK
jgi:SAM-dependent methyltransferase